MTFFKESFRLVTSIQVWRAKVMAHRIQILRILVYNRHIWSKVAPKALGLMKKMQSSSTSSLSTELRVGITSHLFFQVASVSSAERGGTIIWIQR